MFSLVLFFPHETVAEQSLFTFLSYDIQSKEQTVVFRPSGGSANAISKLRIHYLTSSDCQSGYIGFQNSSTQSSIFEFELNRLFGLSANSVYAAGLETSNIDQVESIHSILIRLINPDGHFAWFTSSCNDEHINCCVAVNCSNATGSCLPQQMLSVQDFILNV